MVLVVLGAVAMADAAPRDPLSPPDVEFLEFLGSWHTGDDRWVDPFQVDEPPGAKDSEHNQDVRSGDDRGEKVPQPITPNDGVKQPERDPAFPRRDIKP